MESHEMALEQHKSSARSKMVPILARQSVKFHKQQRKLHPNICRKTCSLLCLFTIICTLLQLTEGFLFEPGSGKKHWTYNDQIDWDARFRSCGLRSQSPIDIQSNLVQENPNLKLQFFNYDKQIKFKLQNAHHTIKLSPLVENYMQNNNNHAANSYKPSEHNKVAQTSQRSAHRVTDSRRTTNHFVASNLDHSPETDASHRKHPFFESAEEMLYMDKSLPDLMLPANNIDNNSDSNQDNRNSNSENRAADQLDTAAASSNGLDVAEDARARLLYEGRPTVRLSTLDDENNIFHLHDIHLHWGERKDNGSEHAIDGRRGAMELHLVHIRSGLNKSSIEFNSDSLLVIGIIIESQRKSNAQFDPIVNSLTRINMTAEPEEIGYRSLLELLPDQLDRFYWYWGSLTTPPCYEVVNWIVMERRLTMNSKQIEMFRQLYAAIDEHKNSNDDDDDHQMPNLIMPNIRSLQPVFDRPIFGTKGLGKRQATTSSVHGNRLVANTRQHDQQQENQRQPPTNRIIVGINEDKNYFKNPQAGISQTENSNDDSQTNSNSHAISSFRIHLPSPSSQITIASIVSFLTCNPLLGFLLITSISFNLITIK